jgi:hypothetical protein
MAHGQSFRRTLPAPPSHRRRFHAAASCRQWDRSGSQTSAKSVEAVFADIAAHRNHADAAQYKIEQPAMRSPYVGLMALWTFNSHGWQSPEHRWPGKLRVPCAFHCYQNCTNVQSPGSHHTPLVCTSRMHPAPQFRKRVEPIEVQFNWVLRTILAPAIRIYKHSSQPAYDPL